MDLVLINVHRLICHKTQANKQTFLTAKQLVIYLTHRCGLNRIKSYYLSMTVKVKVR